jgi:lysyl-tRNA synthetase class 2
MKRLLSAGADAIFQITRAMRRGETGRFHNPEFTMVEWYRVGDDHHDQMDFVERLVRHFYEEARRQPIAGSSDASSRDLSTTPFERLTYDEVFDRFAGTRVLHLSSNELSKLASDHGVAAPPAMNIQDRDGWLNLLLAELIEPHLGCDFPQFVYDYPASQAALAKTSWNSLQDEKSDSPPADSIEVAERFELYDCGVELCNGYHELTDADEFVRRSRLEREYSGSEAEGHEELPCAPLLAGAMRKGIPSCAGVALGLDRLVMFALGKTGISDVIAFPGERA